MTDNPSSPSNQPAKAPRLPSLRVRCALAAGLFALGIALGAAIGPTPQSSPAATVAHPETLIASLLSHAATRAPAAGVAPRATPPPQPPTTAAPLSPSHPVEPASGPHEEESQTPTTSKETPLHKPQSPLRRATRKLTRVTPVITLLMLLVASHSQAEDNPNNYQCAGHIVAGRPEEGTSETQVRYTIACSGPISGYAIQTGRVQSTGFDSAPLVSNQKGEAVTSDSFSCNGELPGFGLNCVGNTTAGFETITGQFTIGSKLCAEPRVEPRLTVAYAYLNEKKAITQAISGPFDLGRPHGCPAAAVASKKGRHHGRGGSRKHALPSKGRKG